MLLKETTKKHIGWSSQNSPNPKKAIKIYALWFRKLKTKCIVTIIDNKSIKLLLQRIWWNIKKMFIRTNLDIYILIDNDARYEKMFTKNRKK